MIEPPISTFIKSYLSQNTNWGSSNFTQSGLAENREFNEDYFHNFIKQTKVKEYEPQINKMVYKLYGLTKEKIAIIEGIKK